MKGKKKLCPYKLILIRNGLKSIGKLGYCAGERCMAYQDGKCARLEQGGKRND